MSHLALAEATWVLSEVYERDAAGVATAVDMLLNHRTLTLQDADVVSAALAHFRTRPSLGFSAGHLPLGTFDRDLGKLPDVEKL